MNFDLCISQNISMFPETNKSQFKKSPFWNKVRKKTETFRFSKEKLVLLMFNQKQSSTIYFLIVVDTITEKSLGFILDWTNCKFACFKETMIPTHIRLNKVFPSCEKKIGNSQLRTTMLVLIAFYSIRLLHASLLKNSILTTSGPNREPNIVISALPNV